MTYFTPAYLDFFKKLAANNNRDWFTEHKKTYESEVKAPFKQFMHDAIELCKNYDDKIDITTKESIFRIYRDVRFSKDKTPYKLNCSGVINHGGRKDHSSIGLYIQSSAEDFRIYSGVYMPSKEQLQGIRNKIADDVEQYWAIFESENFTNNFGELLGEKNKRLPKEFQAPAKETPIIFNKQFYFFQKLPAEVVLEPNLLERIDHAWQQSAEARNFLKEAITAE